MTRSGKYISGDRDNADDRQTFMFPMAEVSFYREWIFLSAMEKLERLWGATEWEKPLC